MVDISWLHSFLFGTLDVLMSDIRINLAAEDHRANEVGYELFIFVIHCDLTAFNFFLVSFTNRSKALDAQEDSW